MNCIDAHFSLILMPCDLSSMNVTHIRPSNTQVIKSQVKSDSQFMTPASAT